jgi:hypothetical protein
MPGRARMNRRLCDGIGVMMLGFSIYTWVHVLLSLVGLAAGFAVLQGLLTSERMGGWTATFLISTVATSATGFGFPYERFLPSHGVGAVSLVVLLFAILGLYVFRLAGAWRWIYAASAVIALWLNVFVTIAQVFNKVPALNAMAPTQSEPPFLITELVVMVIFMGLAIAAARKFHPPAAD